jgi:tetratricopeptide (TPR) repeat protein
MGVILWGMRTVAFAAIVTLVFSLAARSQSEKAEDCSVIGLIVSGMFGNSSGFIDECTAVIQSGQLQGKGLASAYNNRGMAYNNLGDPRRAIEDYNEAIRLDPENSAAYSNRGRAHDDLGEYRRAIADFDEALRLNPRNADTYNERGFAYFHLADYNRAIEDHDHALLLNSGFHTLAKPAYYGRAWAKYELGRNSDALDDGDRALEFDPDQPAFIDIRARALAALGRNLEAIAEFERVIQTGGTDWVRNYQEALQMQGRYRGAIDGIYDADLRAALHACINAGCRLMK